MTPIKGICMVGLLGRRQSQTCLDQGKNKQSNSGDSEKLPKKAGREKIENVQKKEGVCPSLANVENYNGDEKNTA